MRGLEAFLNKPKDPKPIGEFTADGILASSSIEVADKLLRFYFSSQTAVTSRYEYGAGFRVFDLLNLMTAVDSVPGSAEARGTGLDVLNFTRWMFIAKAMGVPSEASAALAQAEA